jgi:short-subunit dehydrogenase
MKPINKVIVITGGGSGIGRELALELIKRGARVAVVDINDTALKETVELAGDNSDKISIHKVNITDKAAVYSLPEQVIAKHGRVDGIINNAGIIQPFIRVNDLDYETIDRVLDINFYGTLYMIKAFLPHLLKQPEGHIVNVSSMGGFLPVPGQSIYGAAKSAVKLLTEGLYAELSSTSVNVTLVFPGAIATNIASNSGIKFSRSTEVAGKKSSMKLMPATEAAAKIIDAMERNKYRACVGKDAKFMDFIYRLNPKFANRFIAKKMANLLG